MLLLLPACACISTYMYICIKSCFYDFWHYHYILQHLNGNIFTLMLYLNGNIFTLMLYSPRAHASHEPYPLSAAHVSRTVSDHLIGPVYIKLDLQIHS